MADQAGQILLAHEFEFRVLLCDFYEKRIMVLAPFDASIHLPTGDKT
ncbi:MAG: hypothetical protein PHI97_32160 [Desulfobulbus sp.]|nr:hypothetical protein [Desulfobulbus sp.]